MTEHLLAGRYELRRPLGSGGMAEVREGFDRLLARRVAVKLLRRDHGLGAEVRERFVREARATASFSHPNAVAIFDVGEDDGVAFLVMELVEGESLAELLARTGQLTAANAAQILSQALAALSAAHAAGLVHRDVKPGNILLASDGTVKLTDFGIAKSLRAGQADLTGTGQVIGTPKYLSPEQVRGHPATPASDVYAAGVVLYEMLAGRPPFNAGTPIAIALAHERDRVPPLRRFREELPAGLAAVVERALEKQPEARYPDAAAFRSALAPFAADKPVTRVLPAAASPTVPTSTPEAQRSRMPMVVALVAGLLLLAAVAFTSAQNDIPATAPTEAIAPEAGVATEPESATTTMPPTTPPPATTPAPPESLPELMALLADDPRAYGEKGPELLELLTKVARAENEESRAEEARKASEEAAKWADDGKLDAEIAALTVRLLEPLAADTAADTASEQENDARPGQEQPPGQEKKEEREDEE